MKFSEGLINAFIINFDESSVIYYCYDIHETRTSNRYPIFKDMKMFKGKNITLETRFEHNSMITKFNESKENRIFQVFRYKYFKLKSYLEPYLESFSMKSFFIGLFIGTLVLFLFM